MPILLFIKPIFLLCLFFIATNLNANNYTLTITDANHHLAEVEVVFDEVKSEIFDVKLPVWRTGKYKILDLAKNINEFNAYDANNNPLKWQKDNKNTWRIFVNIPGSIKVKYQIYANQLRTRVSHIDATHAFIDATGVFVYNESQRDKALTVKLNVPNSWHSVSGMDSIGLNQFKAKNYDQLADSPIESGIHIFDSIKVEEQLYQIVIWGEGNFDIQRLKQDISKLHYQAKDIWKTFPFTRYVFMFHVGDKLRGATEHINSTIIQKDHFDFAPDEKYRDVLATIAHEFIHTWNVKSYRPTGISPYDYDKENYSDIFWIAEGTTSYFDALIATRAKIFSVENYLEILAKDIHRYINKPGRKVMSLSQSSFDTWMNNDANRNHNTSVDIYLKGSLVSWLLDKEIRLRTNNRKSLDDLHYLLFEEYGGRYSGYTSYNVKQLLNEMTGYNFNKFWLDYVEGTKDIDFDKLLSFYALELEKPRKDEKAKASFGIKIKDSQGLVEITLVDKAGPAWKAGLTAGDKLLALDGYRIDFDNYKKHLENLIPMELFTLHYFHQGQLKQTKIIASEAPAEKLTIIPLKNPNSKQKQNFKSWLNIDFKQAFTK